MIANPYQYTLLLLRQPDCEPLGQALIKPDFEPARECSWFRAVRKEAMPPIPGGDASIEPLWHETGEPYLRGFPVIIAANGGGPLHCDFPLRYFRKLAVQAANVFIEQGKLGEDDKFEYIGLAFPQSEPPPRAGVQIETEEISPSLTLTEKTLRLDLAQTGEPIEAEDPPVLLPRRVVAEAAELTRQAGATETGGILIGNLHRDSTIPEVFVEVTAQIPARHTQAELTRLTFTAETWTDVRRAIELRQRNELMLGWWHSHPVKHWKCKDCPLERQRVCDLARNFYSEHDRALHRTVFPRAWSVGLVMNDVAFSDVTSSLFGWRRGALEPRGFYLTGEE